METQLQKFIDYLHRENELLDRLADIAQQKTQLIILNQVDELDHLIVNEAAFTSELQQLEDDRFNTQKELALHWNKSVEQFSASIILNLIRQDLPEFFTPLENEIRRLDFNLTRLKAINSHNNELLEQSLDFLAYMETVINGDKSGVYSHSGNYSEGSDLKNMRKLLDTKI